MYSKFYFYKLQLKISFELYTFFTTFFETRGFDVSARFADRLGMRAANVRLFFIYISFVTVGLSFGIYLTLAFLLRLKDMIYTKRTSVFDL